MVVNTSSAGLAVGQRSAGFGVDDFGEEAVLRYMEAVMLGAFHGYSGAGDLAEAVDVEAFDAQALFDIAAHGVRPGLCAEDAAFKLYLLPRDVHFLYGVGYMEGIGGGAAQHGGAEIPHKTHLTLGIAGGGRYNCCSHPFRAVVCAQTAGEQAVAVGNLYYGAAVGSGCAHGARHDLGPGGYVLLSISHYRKASGGAAGGLKPHYILHGGGKKTVGVIVAKVILYGEGQKGDIVY